MNDSNRNDGLADTTSSGEQSGGNVGSGRGGVTDVRQRASEHLDQSPLIALAGGLAAGALIAALLPRTETESRALGPIGKRLSDGAKTAAGAAKEAGTQRLSELGLTPERGTETLRSIFEGATDAVKTSAQAALSAGRGGQ